MNNAKDRLMINEIIFFSHIFFIILSLSFAYLLGPQALIALTLLFTLLSNILILKSITLFSLTVTACDPFTIGIVLGLNLLQEHYGLTLTKKAITINLFGTLVFILFSQIHRLYLPAPTDTMAGLYEQLFCFVPRITLASIVTYYLSQLLDAYAYRFFKRSFELFFPTHSLQTAASFCSMSCSQLFDTILFTFLGLYGLVASPWSIITVSYTIKMIAIVITSPCVRYSYYLKKNQNS